MNIVQIVHFEGIVKKRYVFKVPDGVKLIKGDLVEVDTVNGKQTVKCVSDSANVDDNVLDMITGGLKVRSAVTAIYKRIELIEDVKKGIENE